MDCVIKQTIPQGLALKILTTRRAQKGTVVRKTIHILAERLTWGLVSVGLALGMHVLVV